MASKGDKYNRRKATTSSISTVVSLTLVLFVLGVLGLGLLSANKVSNYIKERIQFVIYLKENVKEVDIIQLQKALDSEYFVKSTEYVDKEMAKQRMDEEYGEDFISFLGFNPLLASIDVKLEADYAHPDSVDWIMPELMENQRIEEIVYQPDLLKAVNYNSEWIGLALLIISGVLLIIAVALINNTIRLAIYSKRFLIKSMLLVGATSGFIQRPFMLKGLLQGLFGSLISIGLLIAFLFWMQRQLPEFFELNDLKTFGILFAFVLILGIAISWLSTSMSVRKYILLKSDDLYYK